MSFSVLQCRECQRKGKIWGLDDLSKRCGYADSLFPAIARKLN